MKYFLLYLLIINVVSFAIMLCDKQKSIHHQRRIRERTLFGTAIMGGSIGTYLAMETLRHKTKHKKFSIGVPIMVVIHLLIAIVVVVQYAE